MKPLPFVEAIAWAKAQDVVLPDVFYGERMGQARANARTISGLASVDQIQSVFDKLDKMLKNGGTFADFKKAVQAGTVNIGLPQHRLELICRNNIQSAYMGGRWQQVEQNKDNRPYLQYSAINDGRTRPSHRKMHGFIARVDDKIWNEWLPLNGHRCRCSVLSLSEKQAKAIGISEPAKGKPDTGWDYNAGKTPGKGLEQAAKHKKGVVDDRLGAAVEHAAAGRAIRLGFGERFDDAINKLHPTLSALVSKVGAPKNIIEDNVSRSNFMPSTEVITTNADDLVFLHEYGHYIDFQLSGKDFSYLYPASAIKGEGLIDALMLDRKALGLHGKKTMGIKLDELMVLLHDKETVTQKGLKGDFEQSFWKSKSTSHAQISDIVDAVTGGKFYDVWHAAGHGKKYYASKDNVAAEVFANMFALFSVKEWDLVSELFPATSMRFKQLIQENL